MREEAEAKTQLTTPSTFWDDDQDTCPCQDCRLRRALSDSGSRALPDTAPSYIALRAAGHTNSTELTEAVIEVSQTAEPPADYNESLRQGYNMISAPYFGPMSSAAYFGDAKLASDMATKTEILREQAYTRRRIRHEICAAWANNERLRKEAGGRIKELPEHAARALQRHSEAAASMPSAYRNAALKPHGL